MDNTDKQFLDPTPERQSVPENKPEKKGGPEASVEGGWEATLDFVKRNRDGAVGKIKQDDVLLEGHPALTPESQQVFAARSQQSAAEVQALADEMLQKIKAESAGSVEVAPPEIKASESPATEVKTEVAEPAKSPEPKVEHKAESSEADGEAVASVEAPKPPEKEADLTTIEGITKKAESLFLSEELLNAKEPGDELDRACDTVHEILASIASQTGRPEFDGDPRVDKLYDVLTLYGRQMGEMKLKLAKYEGGDISTGKRVEFRLPIDKKIYADVSKSLRQTLDSFASHGEPGSVGISTPAQAKVESLTPEVVAPVVEAPKSPETEADLKTLAGIAKKSESLYLPQQVFAAKDPVAAKEAYQDALLLLNKIAELKGADVKDTRSDGLNDALFEYSKFMKKLADGTAVEESAAASVTEGLAQALGSFHAKVETPASPKEEEESSEEKSENPESAPAPAPDKKIESRESREKMRNELLGKIGELAERILKDNGALDDAAKNDLGALSQKVFDYYQASPDDLAQQLQQTWQRLNEALYHGSVEDSAGRAAALRVFLADDLGKSSPDSAVAPSPDAAVDASAEKTVDKPEEKPDDSDGEIAKLLAAEVSVVALSAAALDKFFFADGGRQYDFALNNLDLEKTKRSEAIDQLLAKRPAGKIEMAQISKQIDQLKEANAIAELRREQWAKQREAALLDQRIAESPDEEKEGLQLQRAKLGEELGQLDAQITQRTKSLNKSIEESNKKKELWDVESNVVGDWRPEQDFAKGMEKVGDAMEKKITAATDTAASFLGGSL